MIVLFFIVCFFLFVLLLCFRFFPLVYYPCGCVVLVAGSSSALRPHGNFVHSISLLTTFNGTSLNHDHAPWKIGLLALGRYYLSALLRTFARVVPYLFLYGRYLCPLVSGSGWMFRFSLRESFILLHVMSVKVPTIRLLRRRCWIRTVPSSILLLATQTFMMAKWLGQCGRICEGRRSGSHEEPAQAAGTGQVIQDQGIGPVELMVDGYDKHGVWWEKDREVEGLWWHYTPGESWGCWKEQTASWK